jgi:hypothetical protein
MPSYTKPTDYPVQNPVLTGVLAKIVAAESFAQGRRDTAFPTLVRYSDAGKCARAIALERILPESEDPASIDVAGEFRMWLGSLIHDHVQSAIIETYGGTAEKTSQLGVSCARTGDADDALAAGHADWVGVIDATELGRICFELKTVGAFAFDQAVGLNRRAYQRGHPHGPKAAAKLQGALNAVANDCDTLIIGLISMEAVSIQLAEKVDMTDLDRICGEWHYSRAEFMPWATAELERAEMIDKELLAGVLPPRIAVGDEMESIALTPENVQSDTGVPKQWNCAYCRCRDACVRIGPGIVQIESLIEATG